MYEFAKTHETELEAVRTAYKQFAFLGIPGSNFKTAVSSVKPIFIIFDEFSSIEIWTLNFQNQTATATQHPLGTQNEQLSLTRFLGFHENLPDIIL